MGGAAWLWLRSAAGNDWLLAQVLPRLQPAAGAIEVGRLRTDLLHELAIDGLVVRDPDGAELIRVARVEAALDAQSLAARTLPVHRLELRGLEVELPDPTVFGRMWPGDPAAPDTPWAGLPVSVLVEAAHVEGRVAVAGVRLDDLVLDVAVTARGKAVSWNLPALRATSAAGPVTLASVGVWSPARTVIERLELGVGDQRPSRVVLRGALDGERLAVDLTSLHLDVPGLVPLVPALAELPLPEPVDATGELRGTLAAPALTLTLQTAGGPLSVSGGVELATRSWTAELDSPGLALDAVVAGLEPLGFAGRVQAAGVGWTWPDGLDASGTVAAVVRARGERAELDGELSVAAGKLTLAGVSADLGWASARTSGVVDVPGRSAQLRVEESGAALRRFGVEGRAGLVGDLELAWADGVRVRVRGELDGTGLAAQGAELGRVSGPVDVAWDGRTATGGAELLLRDLRYAERAAALGTLHVELGPEVRWRASLQEPDREVALVDGSYALATRELRVGELRVELAPGLVLVGNGAQAARLVEGGVADATLDVAVGGARLRARGGVSREGSDRLVVDLDDLALAQLEPVLGAAYAGWDGTLSGHVGLSGRLDAPTIEGQAQVDALTVPGAVHGLSAWVALEGDGRALHVEGEAGHAGQTRARWDLRLPLRVGKEGVRLSPEGPIGGTLTVPPVDLPELRELLVGVSLPKARLSAGLVLSGTLGDPAARLTSSLDVPLGADGPTVRAWADGGLEGGVLSARIVLNQGFVSRLEASLASRLDVAALRGWLDGARPKPDPRALLSDFGGAVVFKQLPIGTVRHFADVRADLDGALVGAVALDGSVFAPRVQGGVSLVGARVGQLAVSPATLDLMPLGLGYHVSAKLGFSVISREAPADGPFAARVEPPPTCARAPGEPAGSLEVKGVVPIDPSFDLEKRGLSLNVSGAGLPLAAVEAFVPGMAETGGCFRVGGTITGSLADPRLDLGLGLTQGVTTLAPLGVRLQDIDVDGRFQAGQLVFDHLRARTSAGGSRFDVGAGGFEGAAVVKLERWLPTELSADVEFDRAWLIATADRRVQVSGDVHVLGKGRNVDVTGSVRADLAYLKLAERFFADARARRLHPDIQVIRPGSVVEAVAEGEGAGFTLNVRPNLTVDLGDNSRLRAAMPLQGAYGDLARSLSTVVVEADVSGVITVRQKSGDLRLTGDVTTDRGEARVLGRPFELAAGGTVGFTGTDYRQPILKLRAVHQTRECGDIVADIAGVPGAPEIDFSTEGEGLESDDAVLQTLILGRCPNSGDAPGQDALGQTLALVTQMFAKDVADFGGASGEGLHVEKLEIEEGGVGRVGIALGRNVFLTTEFDGAAESDENSFSVRVEVGLPWKLYLSFDTGDRGVSSFALRRKWRF